MYASFLYIAYTVLSYFYFIAKALSLIWEDTGFIYCLSLCLQTQPYNSGKIIKLVGNKQTLAIFFLVSKCFI